MNQSVDRHIFVFFLYHPLERFQLSPKYDDRNSHISIKFNQSGQRKNLSLRIDGRNRFSILCGNSICTCLSIYFIFLSFEYWYAIPMSSHALLYASIHTCCCWWCSAYYSCISINMLTYGISTVTHLYSTLAHICTWHFCHIFYSVRLFDRSVLVFPIISNIVFAYSKCTIPKLSTLEREKVFKIERKRMRYFER